MLARMPLACKLFALSLALLAPIHSFAIRLNPTINGEDGSNNIQSPGKIKVSWVAESGDPDSFDIDLVHFDGTHGLLRPNIELAWGEVVLDLPAGLSNGQYANGIYVRGFSVLTHGPYFFVGSQPTSTTKNPPAQQTVTVRTTVPNTNTPATSTSNNAGPTMQVSNTQFPENASSSQGNRSQSPEPTSVSTTERSIASEERTSPSASTIVYAFTSNGQVYTTSILSTPSPGSQDSADSNGTSKVPVGAIVGGVLGALALIGIIIVVLFLLRRRKRASGESAVSLVRVYSQTKSERTFASQPEPPSSGTFQDSSGLMRENHELQERIQALENQQEALVSRLLINGVMAPDYVEPTSTSNQVPPTAEDPNHPRISFHKSAVP